MHISYLPLAHNMERTCHVRSGTTSSVGCFTLSLSLLSAPQIMLYMSGSRIGFFQGDIKLLVADIQELKPTVFISVPRLLNRIYDKVKVL